VVADSPGKEDGGPRARVKLDGFEMVVSELEVEQDYLRRAKRYLEE
jgi:hypothetical protein